MRTKNRPKIRSTRSQKLTPSNHLKNHLILGGKPPALPMPSAANKT